MQLEGTLFKKFGEHQISERFKKREFVLYFSDNPDYPQHVKFEVTQDYCDILDNFEEGDAITVDFEVRGREWTNKKTGDISYFNTLKAWRIQRVRQEAHQDAQAQTAVPMVSEDDDDDLPF